MSDTPHKFKIGREVEILQPDYNQSNSGAADFIKNKPQNLSHFNNDVGYITEGLPAPHLEEIVPETYLPSTRGNFILRGSFFTEDMTVTIEGHTIDFVQFKNSGEVLINLMTSATEGTYDLTLDNGTSRTYNDVLQVILGTVYSPSALDWSNIVNDLIVSNAGEAAVNTFDVTSEGVWNKVFDFTKDFKFTFRLRKNLNETTDPWNYDKHLELFNVTDQSTVLKVSSNTTYGQVQFLYYGTAGVERDDLSTAGTDTELWEDNNLFEFRWVGGVAYLYQNNILRETFTGDITSDLQLKVESRYIDVTDIKYIDLSDVSGGFTDASKLISQFINDEEYTKKGENLSEFVDDIGATDGIVPLAAFIDTTNGDDATATLENFNKPYQTLEAVIAALPTFEDETYTIYISGETLPVLRVLPNRNLKFISYTGTTLDFSNIKEADGVTSPEWSIETAVSGAVAGTYTFENGNVSILHDNTTTVKLCANLHVAGTIDNFYWKNSQSNDYTTDLSAKLRCVRDSSFTIKRLKTSNFRSNIFDGWFGDLTIEVLEVCNYMYFSDVDAIIQNLHIKTIQYWGAYPAPSTNYQLYIRSNIKYGKIGDIVGSNLNNSEFNSWEIIEFDNSSIDTGITNNLVINVREVRGNVRTNGSILRTSWMSHYMKFINYSGAWGDVNIYGNGITIDNCRLNIGNGFVKINTNGNENYINLKGYNSIVSSTPETAVIFKHNQAAEPTHKIYDYGALSTNVSYLGNIERVSKTATFKEKINEVVIRSKHDLVSRPLDSSLTYIIDGEITLLSGEFITLTETGNITINGYGLEASKISKDVLGESIFKSPTGGSGGLQMQGLKFSSGQGSVFDITAKTGNEAIELNVVNFEDCASIGVLDGYRQFLGTTLGIYGCSDGFTLSGTWSGFKITNTNSFGFGATGTLFKAGAGLVFSNRFFAEVNVDLPVGAVLCDFSETNFSLNELFQINSSIAKLGGVLDIGNATSLIPNISANSVKSLWTGNIGLPDTATEIYVEDSNVSGTYTIDWLKDSYFLTLTGDTVFSEINLPASGKNTQEIKVYLTGDFVPTFPAGWLDNAVGTYKGVDVNEITIKFLKNGVYFTKISNSLSVYPKPDLKFVLPAGMPPETSTLINIHGSFFTPATIVEIEGHVVNSVEFVDSGHLKVGVTTSAIEGDPFIKISNGSEVIFYDQVSVSLGEVFIPIESQWNVTDGPINVSNSGKVEIEVNGDTGSADWSQIFEANIDFEFRFKSSVSPLNPSDEGGNNEILKLLRESDAGEFFRYRVYSVATERKDLLYLNGSLVYNAVTPSDTDWRINRVSNVIRIYKNGSLLHSDPYDSTGESYRLFVNVKNRNLKDLKYIKLST